MKRLKNFYFAWVTPGLVWHFYFLIIAHNFVSPYSSLPGIMSDPSILMKEFKFSSFWKFYSIALIFHALPPASPVPPKPDGVLVACKGFKAHGAVWRAVKKCRRKQLCCSAQRWSSCVSLLTALWGAQLGAGGASWLWILVRMKPHTNIKTNVNSSIMT